jgi:hemolysin activation/secretion protein
MKKSPAMRFPAALAACWPLLSAAQTPPDAGSSLRDLGQQLEIPSAPRDLLPGIPAQGERARVAGDLRVLVKSFRLNGHTAFGTATLLALLSDLPGRELGLDELNDAAGRITAHYRAHGYLLSRAYLPAQEIADGVVTLSVLEGRIGKVRVENDSLVRDAAVEGWLRRIGHGDVVEARGLEQRLLPMDDLPGVAVSTRLSPGAQVGESDLIVRAAREPRVTGSFGADNSGNRHTGEYLLNGQLSIASPFGIGDALSLNLLYSDERQFYYQGRYDLPFRGAPATRLGVSASRMDYELAGDFAALEARGTAETVGVNLSHAWVRSRDANLRTELALDRRELRDTMWDGLVDTRKRSRNITLGLSGDWRGDAAVNAVSLRWVSGNLDPLSGELAPGAPQGHFDKLHASWLNLWRLSPRVSLYTALQGQIAGDNLDSSEKITLGGLHGVRAYPAGEAGADEGLTLNLELRIQASESWRWKLFGDAGWAWLRKAPSADEANHRNLSGLGVGVDWQPAPKVTFALLCAARTGDAARADREEDDARLWGQMRWEF